MNDGDIDLPLFSTTHASMSGADLKADGLADTEESNVVFLRLMREAAHRINKQRGRVSIDDLRSFAQESGLAPNSPNAWGAIFHQKGWRVVGHVPSIFPSNRSREIREWTYDGN
jgi:hypothetical protein